MGDFKAWLSRSQYLLSFETPPSTFDQGNPTYVAIRFRQKLNAMPLEDAEDGFERV